MQRCSTLVVPTRGCDPRIGDVIAGWIATAARRDRRLQVVVASDEAEPPIAAAQAEAKRAGARIEVIGPSERCALVRMLISGGIEPEVAELALLDPLELGAGSGANRNALALVTSTVATLQVDDDIYCRPAATPGATEATTATTRDPSAFWFFANESDLEAATRPVDIDPFALQERWLGRRVRQHGGRQGVVVTTWMGIAGDVATSNPLAYLMQGGDSLRRLVAGGEDAWRCRFDSRSIVRGTTTTCIGPPSGWTPTIVGVAANAELPPMLPVYRGHGLLWGVTLGARRDALAARLPWVLPHRPHESRAWTSDAFAVHARGIPTAIAIASWIDGHRRSATSGSTLAELGAALEMVARSEDALCEAVRGARRHQIEVVTRRLDALRDSEAGAPLWWSRRVEQHAAALRGAPDVDVTAELGAMEPTRARTTLCRLVACFGRLLAAWPDMLAICRTGRE